MSRRVVRLERRETIMSTPSNRIGVKLAATASVAVGLTVLQSCCKKGQTPEPAAKIATWRFECPEHSVGIRGVDTAGVTVDSIFRIPLSEPITNIPEYHDCQRFIDSTRYGSIYAIFAAFRLDQIAGGPQPTPVATIYTPDGEYPALGIKPGFNCLVMSKTGKAWKARMIWRGQGKDKANCAANPLSGSQETTLDAKPQPLGRSFAPNSFPPAARWDWDSLNGKQYIGIQCGAAWCEVGTPGFQASTPFEAPVPPFDPIAGIDVPVEATERVQRIKGWYDVQRLALWPNGSNQQPSTVRGVLIPHPALDMINWGADPLQIYRDRWVHVAWAIVDGDYPKWHFKRGNNKISLCYGTADSTSCNIPMSSHPENSSSIPLGACPTDPAESGLRWWSRTESAADSTSYGCVLRMNHKADIDEWRKTNPGVVFRIPGTARWKFLPDDESTWVSCPTGCCTKR